jgi:SlyX protein
MSAYDNDRLIEIETKLAYQEDLLHSLNDIVVAQRNTIDGLERRLKKLESSFKSLNEENRFGGEVTDELPPHY